MVLGSDFTAVARPRRDILTGKRVVVTGGTGSLGHVLVGRLLAGEFGRVNSVVVFSRDEAKQNAMRLEFDRRRVATDEIAYEDYRRTLRFAIGDVSDEDAVRAALQGADVVFHAAALKQVPSCEYFPLQAVRTNVIGAENIVRVIGKHNLPVATVIGISTDKACKPVNVMGMTKALQERIFIQANLDNEQTRFIVARYGNVLASRGSVIPLFIDQVKRGGPLTITRPDMTRFLMSLDTAVDTIIRALEEAQAGETYIPVVPSARVDHLASAIVGDRPIQIVVTGVRPGEKIHEVLISEEEAPRTVHRGDHLVIKPILPELSTRADERPYGPSEYSSANSVLDSASVAKLLQRSGLLTESQL